MARKKAPAETQPSESSETGIAELDEALGGGIPKGSVVLLAGPSGSGKTILAFQWLFNGVRKGENCLYLSLTEPLYKSVKNLETMEFYDREALEDERLKIIDLRNVIGDKGLDADRVLEFIESEVEKNDVRRLCIDSVTGIAYHLDDKGKIRRFIFELGKLLGTLGCTSILTSEVTDSGHYSVYGVEEFISDGILRLDHAPNGSLRQRRLQIVKIRGRGYSTDELRFRIKKEGIAVLPRFTAPQGAQASARRLSTGNAILDDMLSGGVLAGSTTLLTGTTGTGKSIFCMQFVMEGLKRGEKCLYVGFDEPMAEMMRNARSVGWDFEQYRKSGKLLCMCTHPADRFLEEHLGGIKSIVEKDGVGRCVVDSLSSLSYSFSEEKYFAFVKSLNDYLKSQGVTAFFTIASASGAKQLREDQVTVTMDNLLMLRQVEMEGRLTFVLNVMKTKGSTHSKEMRRYSITKGGINIGQTLAGYEGIMTGVTRKVSASTEDRIADEFMRFIGPMGQKAFDELSGRGLSEQSVSEYIDSLVSDGIMRQTEAEDFRASVMRHFGKEKPRKEEPGEEKKGFFEKLFGG
ncbi:MAG: ATPase domain-containing protein [Candidatus Micrarchaeota archaeon]